MQGVVSDRSLWLSCVHADSGELFSVPWVELLGIGSAFGGEPSSALRKRIITMSRLFGHSVEITTLDGSWSNALTRSIPAETHPNMLRHRTPVSMSHYVGPGRGSRSHTSVDG